MNYYTLSEDGVPVPCLDVREWSRWMEANRDKKWVAQDDVGPYWVSTIFLGLDHSFNGGTPVLYETLVFKRREDGSIDFSECWGERAYTRELALESHKRGVEWARSQGQ